MEIIYKYPRTYHIEGSRLQVGDEDLKSVKFHRIKGENIILEEKVDGANSGISFDEKGNLLLQSRGHFLNGGYGEKQFSLFKTWANCYKNQLSEILGSRYIMYGEWLYAKHTVFYDNLTHYFMEFDIYDKESNKFLSTKKRKEMLKGYNFIKSVLVLYEGKLNSLKELTSLLGKSNFKSENCEEALKKQCKELNLSYEVVKNQTDASNLMEGIYIKVESDEEVIERYKYVRSSFLTTILDSETHWINRPILPNKLKDNVDIFSNKEEV
jgi:ATP-dependent RNA circularization protein (DNA/RNA ligase family)